MCEIKRAIERVHYPHEYWCERRLLGWVIVHSGPDDRPEVVQHLGLFGRRAKAEQVSAALTTAFCAGIDHAHNVQHRIERTERKRRARRAKMDAA